MVMNMSYYHQNNKFGSKFLKSPTFMATIIPNIICIGGTLFLHWGFFTNVMIGSFLCFPQLANVMLPLYKHRGTKGEQKSHQKLALWAFPAEREASHCGVRGGLIWPHNCSKSPKFCVSKANLTLAVPLLENIRGMPTAMCPTPQRLTWHKPLKSKSPVLPPASKTWSCNATAPIHKPSRVTIPTMERVRQISSPFSRHTLWEQLGTRKQWPATRSQEAL